MRHLYYSGQISTAMPSSLDNSHPSIQTPLCSFTVAAEMVRQTVLVSNKVGSDISCYSKI